MPEVYRTFDFGAKEGGADMIFLLFYFDFGRKCVEE